MVDTIRLLIPITNPADLSDTAFTPLTVGQIMRARGATRTYLNPSQKHAAISDYRPSLTLYRRPSKTIGITYYLAVEFSAPKLLFGNNFHEVCDSDFERIVTTLQTKLLELTCHSFSRDQLARADVSAWHPCKNITFRNRIPCQTILGTIAKLDVSRRYDLQRTNFRDGHIIHIHCNSIDVAFYDKLADLRKAKSSEKRAFEKDSAIQLPLLESLEKSGMAVLRQEVRLSGRAAIKRAFPELKSWTFESLFRSEFCRSLLLRHWDSISGSVDMLGLDVSKPYELLQNYMLQNPDASARDALAAVGGLLVCGQEGVSSLRNLVEGASSPSAWYRIKKLIRMPRAYRYTHFLHIRNTLESFTPLREGRDFAMFENTSK